MALSFSQAKQIPIRSIYPALDWNPQRSGETIIGTFHHSGMRSPSFKVNIKLNVWYDHGSGEGGTLIDLGAKLQQCSLHEFLDKLSPGNYNSPKFAFHRNSSEIPQQKLEVLHAKTFATLTWSLSGISPTGNSICLEKK